MPIAPFDVQPTSARRASAPAVAGAHFLPFIRRAHDAFGEALGVLNAPRELPDTTALAGAVNALSYSIAEYGRLMVGELVREDAASVERFRRAMGPLDHHRASARRAPGRSRPKAPVPPLPAFAS